MEQLNKNNTLEINPNHSIIIKLNALRKVNSTKASLLAHQMMDNVLLASGVPFNLQESSKRNLDILNEYLNAVTGSNTQAAERKNH